MSEDSSGGLTNRRVLNIAVPIVLSNATVPIIGAVDAGVVGQLGSPVPIGAVGIGALILSTFYWLFGFLRMGTTGFAAQALGQGDSEELAVILSRALWIGGLAGALIILGQWPLFAVAFQVSPASAEVEALARDYMAIRVWSAPALISLYAITGWLIATERTRAVLVIQLWMNGLNAGLDLWFVLGLGRGVDGVAWATFLAEWSGLALGLWFCRDAFASRVWRDLGRLLDRAKLGRFARVNSDILLRSLLLQSVMVSFLFFAARFGDVQLAANHVLLLFLSIIAHGLDGFAFAAETLVGQALGRKSQRAVRRAAVLAGAWTLGTGAALGLVFWLFGGAIVDLMTTSPEVRATARLYLPWLALLPVAAAAPFVLDGVFIGATRTGDMRNMMGVSAAIYFACAVALMPVFGNHGLWAAFVISFVARGVTLGVKYPALERDAAR